MSILPKLTLLLVVLTFIAIGTTATIAGEPLPPLQTATGDTPVPPQLWAELPPLTDLEEPQEEVIRYYEEGTLVVDVTTPAGKVIWRGIASTEVKRALEREARRERLDKAIDQLFREFPWSR